MATIQQRISIIDGVSGPLVKMARGMMVLIDRTARAGKQATVFESQMAGVSRQVNSASSAVDSMKAALGGVIGQFALGNIIGNGAMRAIDTVLSLPGTLTRVADEYGSIQARIGLISEGSGANVQEMNDLIYRSARRVHGSYLDMADSITKIGLAAKESFPDPKMLVPFMEGVQKLFRIGGTGPNERNSAMLQLTQALGSGALMGDEFRAVREAAPLIEKYIAKEMGLTFGELKEVSSKGAITADIIRNAILNNLDEINAASERIGTRWGDVWQDIQTVTMRSMAPVWDELAGISNLDYSRVFGAIKVGLAVTSEGLIFLIRTGKNVVEFFTNNFSYIAPIFFALAGTVGVLTAEMAGLGVVSAASAAKFMILGSALLFQQVKMGASAATTGRYAASLGLSTMATIAQAYATGGLSAALYACPITWIAGAILAMVGVIYLAVGAFNFFAGTSISATGLILGSFAFCFSSIWNILATFINFGISIAEAFMNLWIDPLAAVNNLFADIWNGIILLVGESVNSIIDLVRKIPGMGGISNVDFSAHTAGYKVVEGGYSFKRLGMSDAAENAENWYDIGKNGITFSAEDLMPAELKTIMNQNGQTAENTRETADSAKGIKDALDITEEEIKFLCDVAEREAINRYTTAEVKIEMGGVNNNISNGIDVDGMIDYLGSSLVEAMSIGAERVHPV